MAVAAPSEKTAAPTGDPWFDSTPGRWVATYRFKIMSPTDLTEVELTVREVNTRNLDTNEEETKWQVENDEMSGVIREDTPREALEVFAACLETDTEEARIDLGDLETEPQPLA